MTKKLLSTTKGHRPENEGSRRSFADVVTKICEDMLKPRSTQHQKEGAVCSNASGIQIDGYHLLMGLVGLQDEQRQLVGLSRRYQDVLEAKS